MNQSRITITIPLPIYLYKYVEKKFGKVYEAKDNDWFGLLVIRTLSRKSEIEYACKPEKRNIKYRITISGSKAEKYGYYFNPRNVSHIINAIDDSFRDTLFNLAIFNYENFGIDYKASFVNFLDSYNILEDDINLEALLRDFRRKKNKITNNINK